MRSRTLFIPYFYFDTPHYQFKSTAGTLRETDFLMIYALTDTTNKTVKIGYSTNDATLEQRIKTHQTSCPYKLEVLGSIPGKISKEKEIHELVKGHETGGGREWFNLNDHVKAVLIDWHLMPWELGFTKPKPKPDPDLEPDPTVSDLEGIKIPSNAMTVRNWLLYEYEHEAEPIAAIDLFKNHLNDLHLVWGIAEPWGEKDPYFLIDDHTVYCIIPSEPGIGTEELPGLLMRNYGRRVDDMGYDLICGYLSEDGVCIDL